MTHSGVERYSYIVTFDAAPELDSLSEDYRRCARRLRAVHTDKPERLQPALKQLARAMDLQRTTFPGLEDQFDGPARGFAGEVSSQIAGRTLRYTDRLKLLARADELSIGRFEANLIIALVQHRFPERAALDSDLEHDADGMPVYRIFGIRREIVAFVAVQALIALGAWFIFS